MTERAPTLPGPDPDTRKPLLAMPPGACAPKLAPKLKALGWHIQFFMDLKKLADAEEKLSKLDIAIVIDHFGACARPTGSMPRRSGPCSDSLNARRCGRRSWGLISCRTARRAMRDVKPFARAVVDAVPDRVVWGTDWPHPAVARLGIAMPNDGDLADLLLDWIPDEAQRRKLLADNLARLYVF